MAVTIVFADGSKKMAHNLDDRYERWEMRRSLQDNSFSGGYILPVIDPNSSLETLYQLQRILRALRLSMKQEQKACRHDWQGKQNAGLLRAAIAEVSDQIEFVHKLVQVRQSEMADTRKHELKMERIKQSNEQTRLVPYTRALERLCLNAGIPLPPPPDDKWVTLAEFDEFERLKETDGITFHQFRRLFNSRNGTDTDDQEN